MTTLWDTLAKAARRRGATDQPRHPAGSSKGGEFAPAGAAGGGGAVPADVRARAKTMLPRKDPHGYGSWKAAPKAVLDHERTIAREPNEHGAAFAKDGTRLWAGTDGQPDRIAIRTPPGTASVTHNHPGAGGSFSSADTWKVLGEGGPSEIRAVTRAPDGSLVTYRLRASEAPSRLRYLAQQDRTTFPDARDATMPIVVADAYHRQAEQASRASGVGAQAYRRARKLGASREEAQWYAWDAHTHDTMARLATRAWFAYTREVHAP